MQQQRATDPHAHAAHRRQQRLVELDQRRHERVVAGLESVVARLGGSSKRAQVHARREVMRRLSCIACPASPQA